MRIQRVITTLLAMTVLAGCTSAPEGGDPADIRVGDWVMALVVSPQSGDLSNGADTGYLLLADETGRTTTIATSGMDMGGVIWRDGRIFFNDTESDYVLADELTDLPRDSRQEYQQGMFEVAAGFVSVYNVGFDDTGYRHLVVAGDASGTEQWTTEGMYRALGNCGDEVFGISEATGKYVASENDPKPEVLTRLYPPVDGAEKVVTVTEGPIATVEAWSLNAPCSEGSIFFVSQELTDVDAAAEDGRPILERWDTATGEYRAIPLTDSAGEELSLSPTSVLMSHFDQSSIQDGIFHWIADDKVLATDVSTGITEELLTVDLTSPGNGLSRFRFADGELHVLDIGDLSGESASLTRYDLATGDQKVRIELDLTGVMGSSLIPRGLAINPDWA